MKGSIKMKNTSNQPALLSNETRIEIKVYGLCTKFRAQSYAIQYAEGYMSENEYREMYRNGSDIYKAWANETISKIRVYGADK